MMRRYNKRSWILSLILFIITTVCFYFFQISVTKNTVPYTKSLINEITESAVISSTRYKHVTKSLAELGRTPELSGHILFFNRVPDCGSEMLVLLIQLLQGVNNFRHVRLRGGIKRKLTRLEQEQLVDEVTKIIRNKAVPLSFDRHVHFVNFTQFDRQSPQFINLIRDPLDKLISRIYYKKMLPNPKHLDLLDFPKKHTKGNFFSEIMELCVNQQIAECIFSDEMPYDLTIPYFCGQDSRCMLFNNEWALATAKRNVERYYPVVGILEELNATLEIFEHTLPYFFKGIKELYYKNMIQPHHNKNRDLLHGKDHIQNYFKNLLVCEYDFYEWIKQRLFQQLQIFYGHSH